MRSIAEIDRDHEGMGKACVRHDHGCTYPKCDCDRSKRIAPNVRGVGGPKLATPKDGVPAAINNPSEIPNSCRLMPAGVQEVPRG